MTMNEFNIVFTKEAIKDTSKLTDKEKRKLQTILKNKITVNPFSGKKLSGELEGCYSVRLNLKDRISYSIDKKNHTVCVHKTKTHYND